MFVNSQVQSVSLTGTPSPQLYLITNDEPFNVLYDKIEAALHTGVVSLLQIRRKQQIALDLQKHQQQAEKLVTLANKYGVSVLMNDDMKLAHQLGVGVHLGQDDGDLMEARTLLGQHAIIGRTCLTSPTLVQQAKQEGASYAAMGAVFASGTKPNAKLVSIEQIRQGVQQGIDLCVIGGLTVENCTQLKGINIRYIAVVGDILNHKLSMIAHRCQQWQQVLNHW